MRRATAARQIPPPKKDKIMEINGNSNIDGSIRPHKKNPKQSKFPKKMKITGGNPIENSKQSKFQKKIMKIRGDPLPRSAGKCRK